MNEWTERLTQAVPRKRDRGPRQLSCARCGTEFTCNVGGPCWCSEEPVRLPLPPPGQPGPTGFDDCLCRDCLRAVATTLA